MAKTALIMSRDPKGRHLSGLIDVAIDQARLTSDEAQRVIEDGGGFQSDLVMVLHARLNSFVTPLSDTDLVARYPQFAGLVTPYRRLVAEVFNVHDDRPIVRRLYPGFTMKVNAPKAGPCYNNFDRLQRSGFPDTPTPSALVWGVPQIVPGSTSKNIDVQKALLADLRRQFDMPSHHLTDFGSVGLDASLLLDEFKRTGVCQPLNHRYIRTDSFFSRGYRLLLSWDNDCRLYCSHWREDFPRVKLGCLALGVEVLGN